MKWFFFFFFDFTTFPQSAQQKLFIEAGSPPSPRSPLLNLPRCRYRRQVVLRHHCKRSTLRSNSLRIIKNFTLRPARVKYEHSANCAVSLQVFLRSLFSSLFTILTVSAQYHQHDKAVDPVALSAHIRHKGKGKMACPMRRCHSANTYGSTCLPASGSIGFSLGNSQKYAVQSGTGTNSWATPRTRTHVFVIRGATMSRAIATDQRQISLMINASGRNTATATATENCKSLTL